MAFADSNMPRIELFRGDPILGREPIEVARSILYAAKKGPVEVYIDGSARMAIRSAGVVYADELPALWLVGAYTAGASTVRIMEDVGLRLAEVKAARG